jgi:hypothetical protein
VLKVRQHGCLKLKPRASAAPSAGRTRDIRKPVGTERPIREAGWSMTLHYGVHRSWELGARRRVKILRRQLRSELEPSYSLSPLSVHMKIIRLLQIGSPIGPRR